MVHDKAIVGAQYSINMTPAVDLRKSPEPSGFVREIQAEIPGGPRQFWSIPNNMNRLIRNCCLKMSRNVKIDV